MISLENLDAPKFIVANFGQPVSNPGLKRSSINNLGLTLKRLLLPAGTVLSLSLLPVCHLWP